MNRRPLGATGMTVSEIGFGAWQLGAALWAGEQEQGAIDLVHEALDLGCTLFDTAPGYGDGNSERLLGEALQGRQETVTLVSKYGHRADGTTDFSPENMRDGVLESLQALQTEYLDVLLLHSPPKDILDGSMGHYEELERLKAEGLIRAYGASVDTSKDLRLVMQHSKSQVAEVLFHALDQETAYAFDEAKDKGVGLIVKVPLDSGWLTGKYNADTDFHTGYRERWSDEVKKRRASYVKSLSFLATSERTMSQGALQFILSYPQISSAIPGSRTMHYLRENMAASEGRLSDAEIRVVRKLWESYIEKDPLPW